MGPRATAAAPSAPLYRVSTFLLTVLVLLVLTGCGDDALLPTANQAPDTQLAARAPEMLNEDEFRIELTWSGSDADGEIDHFEWRLELDGQGGVLPEAVDEWIPDEQDGLVLTLPVDPLGEGVEVGSRRMRHFWVRAVDVGGIADVSPAHVVFSALSVAPQVTIELPPRPNTNTCSTVSRVLSYQWLAEAPEGAGGLESRYILFESDWNDGECMTHAVFNQENPFDAIADDDPRWSAWLAYDEGDLATRSASFPPLEFGTVWFFGVQARDEDGLSSSFEWETNVRHVEISPGKLPLLIVTEFVLGSSTFTGEEGRKSYEILPGEPLEFSWIGDAEEYAGSIEAYRYGWDVQDPNDEQDPGWAIPWQLGVEAQQAPPRYFEHGTHNFVVACRDNSGTVTRGQFELQALAVPDRSERRELLLIYDWGHNGSAASQALKQEWLDRWQSLLEGLVVGFDPSRDILDAQLAAGDLELARLLPYKSVIWFLNGGSDLTLFTAMLRPQVGLLRYHWLAAYQRTGNVMMVGPNAAMTMIEWGAWTYPFVYDVPDQGDDGLGTRTFPDGSVVNEGTLRWPYTGWCLELADRVRPNQFSLWGEVGVERSIKCDYLAKARVASELAMHYPSSAGRVVDLGMEDGVTSPRLPDPERQIPVGDAIYRLRTEEFYNTNLTSRPVTVNLRGCQVPMFTHRAARDEVFPPGHPQAGEPLVVDDDEACPPSGTSESPLTGSPIAILSTAMQDERAYPGTVDVLWGFHPLAFDQQDVSRALRWIFLYGWELPTAKR